MYRVTVDADSVGALSELGVDLSHTGYRPSLKQAQVVFVDLADAQAAQVRDEGLALDEVTPGPHVSDAQIEQRIDAAKTRRSARLAAKPETGATRPTRSTTSSAPTPSRAASRTRWPSSPRSTAAWPSSW